ncbi:crossover junction endodeoxyribonuclease RuvC [Cutibacterium sp.]|uniref:crossover junction endodeoxyribonuclease RuvC n=1 Tax=Cutibacterium sp. TaxID=1912221 RepID=UPI0026DD651B|nr:crossover junction endodeoxyribonuclease RuvC [Cutibacterium sp.]MDO4411957.1 crossover junction endodeoxyribonuclease RuvC [Cutibacterium sp.]
MGVDPGLTRCGVGVVEGGLGAPLRLVAVGVIRTPADLDRGHRLLRIHDGLEEWRDHTRPDTIAVERVFAQHNRNTVTGTAQAAGIAMMIAARHGLPATLYTPSEVKAAISGSGRADKAQVGLMVARVLRLSAPPKPADAADAVALAICHVWRGGAAHRVEAAVAAQRRGRPVPRSWKDYAR